MKYIHVSEVKSGDKLGKILLNNNGGVLLREDTILTNGMITLLNNKVEYLYIDDEKTKDIIIDDVIPQKLKIDVVRYIKELNIEKTIDSAKNVVDNLLKYKKLSVDVYSSSDNENSLYEHSLSVTQLTVLFGRALGFNEDELNKLAVASLLHDIGKICEKDSANITKYNMKLTFSSLGINLPDSYIDILHPLYGYAILKDDHTIDSVIKNSILRHHENYDKSGIVYKKSNDAVDTLSTKFAKIINISDTFVRLMTNTYKDANVTTITEAIEYISAYSDEKFDRRFVDAFFANVPILPVGLTIELSNGKYAVIAEENKGMPTRPKINIDGVVLDLSETKNQNLIINNIVGNVNEKDNELKKR